VDLDLPGLLRRARRDADLSQRELAACAGVGRNVVGEIEAGTRRDPRVRTLERLLHAAGYRLAVLGPDDQELVADEPELRDRGGRRYPAHLDVRPVNDLRDWWAWREFESWADPPVPAYTFDVRRDQRDWRRRVGGLDPKGIGWFERRAARAAHWWRLRRVAELAARWAAEAEAKSRRR
jgi:transcriptional regulator with XRE-family HTH domain